MKKRKDRYTDKWFKDKIYAMRDDIVILNNYETKYSVMECQCKKHTHYVFSIKATNLSSGHGKCKLCRFEKRKLHNKKFGRLTVLELNEEVSLREQTAYWKCKCDCGNIITVLQASLLNGNTTSCGCAKIEATINYNKTQKSKTNEYRFDGDTVIGRCFNKDVEFMVDLDDYDRIVDYCWFEDGNGYINARDKENNKTIKLHRLIMGLDYGDERLVDHINHDGLNNKKINLRVCDKSKNAMNASLQINNTSGICGVSYNKTKEKWSAYIRKNNKQYYLGSYINFDDAVAARKKAEQEMYGEYSYDASTKKNKELFS